MPAGLVAVGLRQLMRPVDDLITAAGEVARGNFGQAIESPSDDEIGVLAKEFNVMASRLRESYDTLEQRVADRTEELRSTNQTLNALIHASPLPIVTLNMEAHVQSWNQAATDVFGWTEDEILSRPYPLAPGEKEEELHEVFNQAVHGDHLEGLETRRQRKDGSWVDVSIWTAPLQDSAERMNGFMAVLADLTEHKRAETAVRELALFAEMNPAPVLRFDTDGSIVSANPAALELMGDQAKAGTELTSILPGLVEIDLAACIREGQLVYHEAVFGKRHFQCAVRGVPELQVGHVYATDITGLKRTEIELQTSEERYRALFEESSDAIFVSDADGKVISANQAALDLFGFHGEDAIGSDVGERFSDATDRESFRRNVAEAGSVRDFEVKLVRKDGTVMDCLMTASRRFDETGRNAGLQGTIRNITERKLVERTHRDLAVVGERNRMAREIHDTLAQGFTGIVLQLEAAEQAFDQSPEEAAEYLTRAKDLGRESLQEARRSVFNLTPKALEDRPLVDALRHEVDSWSEDGSESAALVISGRPGEMSLDAQTAVLRICQEALANVRKHAEASSVQIDASFSDKAVRLRIKDDGVGFDPQSNRDVGAEGGFGLTGMEQRATLLSGTLTVASGKGQGTTVKATIPV